MTQDLIDLAYQDAELERHGHFTLAVEKAQEKLKKFQLPDPRYYITQMIQALLASGSTTIQVESSELQVWIRFDGPGYQQAELEHITDAVFESGKDRSRDRLRELALGLLSVQGLRPREVKITSQGSSWSKSGKVQPAKAGVQEIWIHHSRGNTNEDEILRQQCQSCAADISFNGSLISSQYASNKTSCPWPNFRFEGNGFRGAFGIAYGDIKASSLVLTRHGVVFSRRHEERIKPALVVELEHEHLRKNASQSDVVEDQNYTNMLAELQKVQLEFALQLSTQRTPPYQAQQVYSYLGEVAFRAVGQKLLRVNLEELGQLERKLVTAPFFLCSDNCRRNALELWQAMHRDGVLYYSAEKRLNFSDPKSPILSLSDTGAFLMKEVYPQLTPLPSANQGTWMHALAAAKQRKSQKLPPVLASRTVNSPKARMRIVILDDLQGGLDDPGTSPLDLYWVADDRVSSVHHLNHTPLSFAILSEQNLRVDNAGVEKVLTLHVEPLYLSLAQGLEEGQLKSPARIGALAKVAHYLAWKFSSLVEAFEFPEWCERRIFFTVNEQPVSLADMRAWLQVYPTLVATYGAAVSQEDFALQITPPLFHALREILGAERFLLCELADPKLLERGQQSGLSRAASAGVQVVEVVDEDQELEAIRQEIEAAKSGGLRAAKDDQIDEEAVIQSLGLKTFESGGKVQAPSLPVFVKDCLKASESTGTRWITKFQLAGLDGQLLVHEGAFPRPLQPDTLWVKVADNDPVAFSTQFLGVSGWLYIPPHWRAEANLGLSVISPDDSPVGAEWPMPELPFDLGMASVQQEFVWTVRRLYKLAAQHLTRPDGRPLLDLWSRRLLKMMIWDPGWTLASELSWFRQVPFFSNLEGQFFDLESLQYQSADKTLYWVGLESGRAPHPRETLRLLPPLNAEVLQSWLKRPLEKAQLLVDDQPAQQLLAELRQQLVKTCQEGDCPLQPDWLDGLDFGEPTRWFRGPRKYFIEHEAGSGQTRLNPADNMFPTLFRHRSHWNERIPVLSSAIYTAINRALHEVEDEHEMAYLEAMLRLLS